VTATRPEPREPELALLIAILAAVYCLAAWRSWENVARWTIDVEHASARVGYTNAAVTELVPLASALAARVLHRCGKSRALPVAFLLAFGGLSLAAQVAEAPHTRSGWLLAAVPLFGVASVIELLFVVTVRPAPVQVHTEQVTSAPDLHIDLTTTPATATPHTPAHLTAVPAQRTTARFDPDRLHTLLAEQPGISQVQAARILDASRTTIRKHWPAKDMETVTA
jgi:hypothetical protein